MSIAPQSSELAVPGPRASTAGAARAGTAARPEQDRECACEQQVALGSGLTQVCRGHLPNADSSMMFGTRYGPPIGTRRECACCPACCSLWRQVGVWVEGDNCSPERIVSNRALYAAGCSSGCGVSCHWSSETALHSMQCILMARILMPCMIAWSWRGTGGTRGGQQCSDRHRWAARVIREDLCGLCGCVSQQRM